MRQKDKNYNTHYNESDLYLAVGPNNEAPKTHEDQMEELREYFKTKIVNAYNSICRENTDPNYSYEDLTDAEKMIRRMIIKEKDKARQRARINYTEDGQPK